MTRLPKCLRPWLVLLLLAGCLGPSLRASVRLPSLLADGMVLQQRRVITLWGQADPGEQIRIRAGWAPKAMEAKAGPDGRWQVRVQTPAAGGPYRIDFDGKNHVTLKDVLIGEVWVCSGQSNMEWTLEMLGGWGAFPQERAGLGATGDPGLRLCTIPKTLAASPLDHCDATWHAATADHVTPFSAVAYFYGRELRRRLKVPIGLISAAWGGTGAECWIPRDRLERDPDLISTLVDPGGDQPNRPSVLYNAMIHPLLPFAIQGVIWYQGESNTANADLYDRLFPALIRAWREAWGQGDFPFYFVQIAPYLYPDAPPTSAYVRDAQRRALALPNTGMTVTLDIADPGDLHPRAKPEIARRLALWALARTYHRKVGAVSGPLLRKAVRSGGQMRLSFEHTQGGLKARAGVLRGFQVAAKGGPFLEAEARLDKNTVVVWHPEVPAPAEVRYAFSHAPEASLFNGAGLPASPFQTETRPLLLRRVAAKTRWDAGQGAAWIELTCGDPRGTIRFTLDGRDPGPADRAYGSPLSFTAAAHLRARVFLNGQGSEFVQDIRFAPHLALGKPHTLTPPPQPRYPGGPGALVDGFEGSEDFTDGRWMGFEGDDADILLDLGRPGDIGAIAVVFLDDPANWIFAPPQIVASTSLDGITFAPAGSERIEGHRGTPRPEVRTAVLPLPAGAARYLRLRVKNLGVCPPGHAGEGEKAWLFLSEVRAAPRSTP
jgi:sialate O-acetylesterase